METLSKFDSKTGKIEQMHDAVRITWSSDTGYQIDVEEILDWIAIEWNHILSWYEWNLRVGSQSI